MRLNVAQLTTGRVVTLSDDNEIFCGQNYNLVCFKDSKKCLVAKVNCLAKRKFIEASRLLCRLLRHEIRAYTELKDKSKLLATRQALFYGDKEQILLKPSKILFNEPVKPPMTLTTDPNERILWGEYWGNNERKEVKIFCSEDKGATYHVAYVFKSGEIRHVHNIIYDSFLDGFWVTAGDHNREPGIGFLTKDFKSFNWLVKGEQKYRAVNCFVFDDFIVYGTDTEKDFNGIYSINKKNGKSDLLASVPGSCIYSAKFGQWYTFSTSVEYFEKYKNKLSTIWISKNAFDWKKVYEADKDIWSKKYFQFGSIVLPRVGWNKDVIVFSGQALKGIDNKIFTADVLED